MKKTKKATVRIAFVAVALIAVLAIWIVHVDFDAARVQVDTATVSSGTIQRRIVATGTLEALTSVQVGAQVSGTIRSLNVDYNAIVHKGQVLATIDPSSFEAQLREADAALEEAEAARAKAVADASGFETAARDARTKFRRLEQLAAGELVARSDLDDARTAAAEADADVHAGESLVLEATAAIERAKAAVNQSHFDLDRTIISSPIDGIVIARNVDVGQTVVAAVQAPLLFDIAGDLRHMQVEADIDESDIGAVRTGEPVAFEVQSYPDEIFQGTVSAVRLQPVADPNAVVSFAAMIDVRNPDEKLRPGMTATVALASSRLEHVVRIPNAALSFQPSIAVLDAAGQSTAPEPGAVATAGDPAMRRVWRFDGTELTPIPVRVGLSDRDWTELVSGPIHPGETLVVQASTGHRSF